MTLQMPDTIIDRVARVKHTIRGQAEPGAVHVTVDGPCPTPGCDARLIEDVRSDSDAVSCRTCGHDFAV